MAWTEAGLDGRFQANIFGPHSSEILVKADPSGFALRRPLAPDEGIATQGTSALAPVPGTILRVPDPPTAGPGIPVAGAGLARNPNPSDSGLPAWSFQGTTTHPSATLTGTFRPR